MLLMLLMLRDDLLARPPPKGQLGVLALIVRSDELIR
jgi:hypothetical protein